MSDKPPAPLTEFLHLAPPDQRLDHALVVAGTFKVDKFNEMLFDLTGIHLPDTIRRASGKRQAEYFAGRYLAALALRHFGVEQFDVLADEKRCPDWPNGFIGSISHTDNFAVCALAPTSELRAIGIDCQDILTPKKAAKLWPKIIDENEYSIISAANLELNYGLSLCFSAKESIYKALYPFIRKFFGFSAAKLCAVNPRQHYLEFQFSPQLATPIGINHPLRVYYQLTDGRVLSHISLGPNQINA